MCVLKVIQPARPGSSGVFLIRGRHERRAKSPSHSAAKKMRQLPRLSTSVFEENYDKKRGKDLMEKLGGRCTWF